MPTTDDIRWFKQQFAGQIKDVVAGTPFDVEMPTSIARQETGYIWSALRKKGVPLERIVALCVGDTIDYKSPDKGRQVFPLNKADLLSKPRGSAMFAIARAALEDMVAYVPGYEGAVANPDKFCHGYGVFQRDLQFFLDDPDYFLDRSYENFADTLVHCLAELQRGLSKVGLKGASSITDYQFACVAIAYNRGKFNPNKGLKQGYFDGYKYYGEYVAEYLASARSVAAAAQIHVGRYVVIARDGLRLRGGPGTEYEALKTLPTDTRLDVVDASDGPWVQVDLEGDGLLDGYGHSAFLAREETGEHVLEPA
ncbi:SH3 domain-containing protein [Rhizobium sp. WYJ-E13]|uniref:SH3 domain-containing protein n=1 Tax=Rhizobium sp. WYJ-E13 TaxID=2849093 RepID=UPI001C1ED3F9|nr:SH3 domain-containing protein [Rhizobium sp. WYJ-E13]QWW71372.1 SH3 domain-containing protein [Rhizobium sp. WYJ-E13]